jgi:hypothetical protein
MDLTASECFFKTLETKNILLHQYFNLQGLTLHEKIFRAQGTLTNMKLSNCRIMNSSLDHCLLLNCELQGCRLTNSNIKDSKVVDSKFINSLRSKCDVTPTPPLNCIPPEIRFMIFSGMISWTGKAPASIAALRGDPVFYHKALGVLRRTCTFSLHIENHASRKTISQAAFKSIKKLKVE